MRLGRHSGAAEVTHKVERVLRHPDFVRLSVNDIALLKLETKVQFTGEFQHIGCFNQSNYHFSGLRSHKTDLFAFINKQGGAGHV